MESREDLLQRIKIKNKLDTSFLLKIYGYELSYPGFADEAIKALNDAGCSRAREYYDKAISVYKKKHDKEMKEVAHWLREEYDRLWQKRRGGGDEQRKQKIQSRNQKWKELSQILNFQ